MIKHSNKIFQILFLLNLFLILSCETRNNSEKSDKPEIKNEIISKQNNDIKKELDFLKTFNGRYPHEIKLLDSVVFTKRLEKLLGENEYNFLIKTWAVESPIEIDNNLFVAEACQVHNCSATNFIIVFDFEKGKMHVGIRKENDIKTFSEDDILPSKVEEWKKKIDD